MMRFSPCVRRLPATALAITALVLSFVAAAAQHEPCGSQDTLVDLFNYSQLAERPTDVGTDEPTTCEYGQDGKTADADQLTEIAVTNTHATRLQARLHTELNDNTFARALDVAPNALYVGCHYLFETIEIAVELRLFRRPEQGDLVRPEVVGRLQGSGDGTWTPLKLSGDVVSLPGTKWSRPQNVVANLFAEHCAFPAARFAVLALCQEAHVARDARDRPSILTPGTAPTLVGHSLGATTAQFIMSTPADNLPACPQISAYAFSSLGLEESDVAPNGAIFGALTSYVSTCDWMAQLEPFDEQLQPGHLFTLSNSDSHYLDDIQEDLCICLRGDGYNRLVYRGKSRLPPSNTSLCPHRPSGQMRRTVRAPTRRP